MAELSKEGDALYELPLDEFTSARTELERRLRKEGKREEAAQVKALRKPTAAAWALNQVARSHPADVEQLREAGAAVEAAQEELLGGGSRDDLRAAVERQRALVASLTRAAVEVAGKAGIATTAAFEDKIGSTLRAAATDAEVATELEAGRLVKEHEAVGLFGLGLPIGDEEGAAPSTTAKKGEGDGARGRSGPGGKGDGTRRTTGGKGDGARGGGEAGGKSDGTRGRSKAAGKAAAARGGRGKGKAGSARDASDADRERRKREAAERRERERTRRELEKRLKAAKAAAQRALRAADAADRALEKERERAERAMAALREAESDAEEATARAAEAEEEAARLEAELGALA